MFDQPNPNPPAGGTGAEPEDILSPSEGAPKPQSALEAGRLRPAPQNFVPPAGGQNLGGPSAVPAGDVRQLAEMAGAPAEEVEIRSPLLNKRNLVIAGVVVLVIIAAVVVIVLVSGTKKPPAVALPEQVRVAPSEVAPIAEPTPPPGASVPGPVVTEPTAPPAPAPTPTSTVATAPPDSDGDGLSDAEEARLGTNPLDRDTDHDGLTDYEEVKIWHTNPLNPDTDGDGYPDGQEVKNGYNPNGPGKLLGPPPRS